MLPTVLHAHKLAALAVWMSGHPDNHRLDFWTTMAISDTRANGWHKDGK
jgi:hypothetical protein